MRITPIAATYLELACYGMTTAEITRRYGLRDQEAVARIILRTAREVGRLGFWKFHVQYVSDIAMLRGKLLSKMMTHGYLMARAA